MNRDAVLAHIQKSSIYAQWWIAYANTARNKERVIFHGGLTGMRLNPDELVQDAMQTASVHIRHMDELTELLEMS